jgi:hypothetical protein
MAKAQTKQTAAAPAVHTPSKGGGTVTVACKFPAGILLQLCRETTYVEETSGGTRLERRRFDKVGKIIAVRGPARANGQTPKGYVLPHVEGGYALTHGVDKDFFEEWMRQNKDNPLVTNGMIFACDSVGSATSKAREQEELLSGFEPITPDDDPRIPRSLNPLVSPVETAERG